MADRSGLTDAGHPVALVLVRHAETPWVVEDRFQGRADTHLSANGKAQAAAVGRRLARPLAPPPLPLPEGAPTAIWHSPLERAAATAQAIAAARQPPVPLQSLADLIELDVGHWEGLTNTEVGLRWPAELAAWRHDPTVGFIPGGEPAPVGAARVRRGLEDIISTLDEASTAGPAWAIAVSHDGILRLALLGLLEVPLGVYWSFPMAAAGITVVDRLPGGPWRLRLHGLTGSAEELALDDVPGA